MHYDTVLIIEDDKDLRELLKFMLEENGIKVLSASDGVEAVEIFFENKDRIGIVVADIGMPRLSGWDAFLKIKNMNSEVKGILSSGFFSKKIREEIVKSGGNCFIEKPYKIPELIGMIKDMLNR